MAEAGAVGWGGGGAHEGSGRAQRAPFHREGYQQHHLFQCPAFSAPNHHLLTPHPPRPLYLLHGTGDELANLALAVGGDGADLQRAEGGGGQR